MPATPLGFLTAASARRSRVLMPNTASAPGDDEILDLAVGHPLLAHTDKPGTRWGSGLSESRAFCRWCESGT
jgi:hypothetical protein